MDEEPHDKTYLTTRFGRWVDRVTYLDIGVAIAVALGCSTFYFWLATPSGHGLDKAGAHDVRGFGTALYFSIVTFTSLGYGDFAPQGAGRLVASLLVFLGLALVALSVGKVASERQYSLLLLLHTSDAQRRLSSFSERILLASGQLERASARAHTARLRLAIDELGQLIATLSRYAIFNSHQARLTAFGNRSTLNGLFEDLYAAQLACGAAFRSLGADQHVCSRALGLMREIERLSIRLVNMQEKAKEEQTSLTLLGLRKLLLPMRGDGGVPLSGVCEPVYPVVSPVSRFTTQREQLETWSLQHMSAWLRRIVLDALPDGKSAAWCLQQHKDLASSLGISNTLAYRCIKDLIKDGRVPKKPPVPPALREDVRFSNWLQKRALDLHASSQRLEQAVTVDSLGLMCRALAGCEAQLASLEEAIRGDLDDRWATVSSTGPHRFFLLQLRQTSDSCRIAVANVAPGGCVAFWADAVTARIEAIIGELGGVPPSSELAESPA